MTADGAYDELGGQLPDESDRERGRRHVDQLRDRLNRPTPPCDVCSHSSGQHGAGGCMFPVDGGPCGCKEVPR